MKKKYSITIGDFDGLHLGHFYLLKKLINIAKKTKTTPLVITFHNDFNVNNRINLDLEKEILFNKLNLETIFIDLNKIKSLTGKEFFDILQENLEIKNIILGNDFRFGRGRQESINELKSYLRKDKKITIVKNINYKNEKISSTKIRQLIKNGNIKTANKLLYKNYYIISKKIKGSGIGTKIGFPTINFSVNHNKILPKGIFLGNISHFKGINKHFSINDNNGKKPEDYLKNKIISLNRKINKTFLTNKKINWDNTINCLIYIGDKPTLKENKTVIEAYIPKTFIKHNEKDLFKIELIDKIGKSKKFSNLDKLLIYINSFNKKYFNYLYK